MEARQHLSIIKTAFLLLSLASGDSVFSQTAAASQTLVKEQPVERELKGSEAHSYGLALLAGQYLDVVVEQKGIDVVVVLFDPSKKKVVEVDSPNGTQGPEPVTLIAETTGNYFLEVRSLENTAPAGRYEVRIRELRPALDKDRNMVAAQRAFNDGEALREQRTAESLLDAIKKYEEALPFFRAAEDRKGEAKTLRIIGALSSNLGEYQKALAYYNQALTNTKAIGDQAGEAVTLTSIGLVYDNLRERQKALAYFAQALPLLRAAGDKAVEAATLNSIGAVYDNLGERQKALEYYNLALPLLRALSDKVSEARTLTRIGSVYDNLGERQQALAYYNQSLVLSRAVGDKPSEARTLTNIGLAYNNLGDRPKALAYFAQALPLQKTSGDKAGEALTLANTGLVYNDLGERQKALEYYHQAQPLLSATGLKADEARVLTSIGLVHKHLGEQQKALAYFAQALPLQRAYGDKVGEASTLTNIGLVYNDLGERQKALEYYAQALPLYRAVGYKAGEARTLSNIGFAYNYSGDRQKALEYYYQALPLLRAVGDKAGEAAALGNASVSIDGIGNRRFAVAFGKFSVNRLQEARLNVTGLDKNLQQSYLRSVEITYHRLADILLTDGRLAEAHQVLNSFKDQQFFDFDRQAKQLAPIALTARETDFVSRYLAMTDKIGEASAGLETLRRGLGDKKLTADEQSAIQGLEKSLQLANDDYLAFLKTIEREFAAPLDDRDKVPASADLQMMQSTLRETSSATKQNTVAIYTLVSEDNYRALVITSNDIFSVATPIKGADLNQKAQQLWRLLRTPQYDPQLLAKEVYDIVFASVAGRLPKDTKTILWSLDGSLRYIPMATLFDGKRYLIERYQNVLFTRADKERLTREVAAHPSGTGFGSSEAHTVELIGTKFKAAALPAVKLELSRIFKQNNSSKGALSGDVLLDAGFTRPAMLSALQKHRPLVHIASHFKFEPGDETRSFLLLGDGSPFTLDEMKMQRDLFDGVDLLTLSACQTAAQRADANGREVDGFAELAQRLGAGAVMASLWEVSDNSTAELMARFYRNYNSALGTNKATALRQAQLALLHGDYKPADAANRAVSREEDADIVTNIKIEGPKLNLYKSDLNKPFAHPFYWSPFVLIGNWK